MGDALKISSHIERFFLFISSSLNHRHDHLFESIYFQYEDREHTLQGLADGSLKPDLVLIQDFDQSYDNIIRLLKDQNIPIVLYTPKYIPSMKEIALKLRVDDYLSGAINEDFVKHVDFLKKLKLYKYYNRDEIRHSSHTKYSERPAMQMRGLKRIFDVALSLLVLGMLSPLLVIIAIIIKLESKGPVFYISKRSGAGYKVFDFYKFRTMHDGAASELVSLERNNQYSKRSKDAVFYKIKNDPRVTKFGQFLRDTSLDELPQLINVVKGDMSLVGNRPLPLYEAEKLTRDQIALRFLAPAGITGLWQVTKRGKENMSPQERIQLDMEYAVGNSFIYDMKILVRTIPAMLQREKV